MAGSFFFFFNIIYFSIPWFSHRYNIKVSREFWRKATWIQINLLQSQKQAKFFFLTFSFFSCFALYFFLYPSSAKEKKSKLQSWEETTIEHKTIWEWLWMLLRKIDNKVCGVRGGGGGCGWCNEIQETCFSSYHAV